METTSDKPGFRDIIAKRIFTSVIVFTGILGLIGILLGVVYLFMSKDEEKGITHSKEILQYVFTALLPLWGTWIGTVLAYYFSKENFEAANKQVRELVNKVTGNDRLKSLKVTEVMMPYEKIKRLDLPFGGGNPPPPPPAAGGAPAGPVAPPVAAPPQDNPETIRARTLYEEIVRKEVNRALIFKEKKIIYALHKSLIGDFLLRTINNPNATIADMKNDLNKDLRNAFQNGVQTISKGATLLDVKMIMENLPGCQDVFVTETGKKEEDVLGWITNIDLMNNSEA